MRTSRNAVWSGAAVIGALTLAAVVWLLPASARVPAAAVAIAGPAALALARRRQTPAPMPPRADLPVPAPPPELGREQVPDVPLPSSHPDYCFRFSATVVWEEATGLGGERNSNMAARAVGAVLERARSIAAQREPGSVAFVQYELAGELGELRLDVTHSFRMMAESVQLRLTDADQARLDKIATMRKEQDVWEHQLANERGRRHYLGTDVLKDPGSAVVWWLSRHEDQLDQVVSNIGLLARLSAAANNESGGLGPEPPLVVRVGESPGGTAAADHFGRFLDATGLRDHQLFARQVANCARANGRDEVADELTRRYDSQGNGLQPDRTEAVPPSDGRAASAESPDTPDWLREPPDEY